MTIDICYMNQNFIDYILFFFIIIKYNSKNSEKTFNKEKWYKELIPIMQLWKKVSDIDYYTII